MIGSVKYHYVLCHIYWHYSLYTGIICKIKILKVKSTNLFPNGARVRKCFQYLFLMNSLSDETVKPSLCVTSDKDPFLLKSKNAGHSPEFCTLHRQWWLSMREIRPRNIIITGKMFVVFRTLLCHKVWGQDKVNHDYWQLGRCLLCTANKTST